MALEERSEAVEDLGRRGRSRVSHAGGRDNRPENRETNGSKWQSLSGILCRICAKEKALVIEVL